MRRFFLAHLFEHLRRRRIRFAQLVRKFAENPSIFFFVLNRQRQDFTLAQILEFLQHSSPLRVLPRRKNRTTPPPKSSQRALPHLAVIPEPLAHPTPLSFRTSRFLRGSELAFVFTVMNQSGKKSMLPAHIHNLQPAVCPDFPLHPVQMVFHRLLG